MLISIMILQLITVFIRACGLIVLLGCFDLLDSSSGYTKCFTFKRVIGHDKNCCNIELVYVIIAWVAVKFGINTTSVVLEMGKISQGGAE